jgi:RNA polymerase sigma-70 factor (ECF subfamily)
MTLFRNRPELLQPFRLGDRKALEAVYWAYVKDVEAIIRHGFYLSGKGQSMPGAPSGDIGDLVQEVFLRAFAERARAAYDGLREYKPYLATIARNLLVDWARKHGRDLSLDELSEEPSAEPVPWEIDERRLAIVEDYLARLASPLKEVHQARYISALSQEMAATRLGISRQQLRTREAQLRSGLKEALKKAGLE